MADEDERAEVERAKQRICDTKHVFYGHWVWHSHFRLAVVHFDAQHTLARIDRWHTHTNTTENRYHGMLRLSFAPHHFCLLKWKMILRSNLSLVTFQFIGINFSSVIWDAFFLFDLPLCCLLFSVAVSYLQPIFISKQRKKKKLTNFHIPALKAETRMPHARA